MDSKNQEKDMAPYQFRAGGMINDNINMVGRVMDKTKVGTMPDRRYPTSNHYRSNLGNCNDSNILAGTIHRHIGRNNISGELSSSSQNVQVRCSGGS